MRLLEWGSRAHARSWDAAFLVASVGIALLVRDSWPVAPNSWRSPIPVPWANLHAVFGVLLWIMVVVQFRKCTHTAGCVPRAHIDASCRQLSRAVYLLLYVLFGAQQIISAAVRVWNDAASGALRPAVAQPPENLRDYLAYGILALLTLRGLAALHRRTLKPGVQLSTYPHHQHDE